MSIEYCQRPNCGGWAHEIVDSNLRIEKICSKCARPIGDKIEVIQSQHVFTEFNQLCTMIKSVAK